jgi:WD40 repeat protein
MSQLSSKVWKAIYTAGVLVVLAMIAWFAGLREPARDVPDIRLPASPWRIRPSRDGTTLACLSLLREGGRLGGSVTVVDAAQRAAPREFTRSDAIIQDVAWSADDRRLALGTANGLVELCEVASGRRAWSQKVDRFPVWSVALTESGAIAVSGCRCEPGCEGMVTFLDDDTGETEHVELLHDTPSCLAVDVIGNRLYTGCYYGGLITVFDIAKRSRVDEFGWRKGIVGDWGDAGILDLAISDDGHYLIVGGDDGWTLWDVRGGRQMHERTHHDFSVLQVQFLPGSERFVAKLVPSIGTEQSGTHDERVQIWMIDGDMLHRESDKAIGAGSIAFLPKRNELLLTMKRGIRRLPLPTALPADQ